MQQQGQPQVADRESSVGQQFARVAARVAIENGLQIGGPNASADEFLPIPGLRQIGLGAEQTGRMHHGVFERLTLEGLESVLGDEHADGALRRQESRCRLNGRPDRFRPACLGCVQRGGRRGVGGLSVVGHAGSEWAGAPQKPGDAASSLSRSWQRH